MIVRGDEHEMRAVADVVRGIDARQARHVDVEETDIRLTLVEQPHRLPPVPRLGHDLQLGPRRGELAPQRIAQQRFIVGDQRCRVDDHGSTPTRKLRVSGAPVCAGISISTAAPRGAFAVRRRCAASPKISRRRSRSAVRPMPRPSAD